MSTLIRLAICILVNNDFFNILKIPVLLTQSEENHDLSHVLHVKTGSSTTSAFSSLDTSLQQVKKITSRTPNLVDNRAYNLLLMESY